MADKVEQISEGGDAETNTKAAKKSGLMTLIKAVAFVSVIILLQIAAASVLVPSAEETAQIANQLAATGASDDVQGDITTSASDAASESPILTDMSEVSLGAYHVVTYDTDTGASLNVDFDLFATVQSNEESEFFTLFESNSHRIRDQIFITVRGTEVTDLTDPTLGLIKRKILEKTNRALGKPLLHEVVFSKFSFVER